MIFDSWSHVGEVVLKGAATYLAVVVALRFIGARALAQMSAYDLICTIALGSFVASLAFSTKLPLLDGLAAIGGVLALQELLRVWQFHSKTARHIVSEQPCVVVWKGKLIEERLASHSVTVDEIRAAARRAGMASIDEAQAIVLENDGNWSVVRRGERSDLSAFEGLDIPTADDPLSECERIHE